MGILKKVWKEIKRVPKNSIKRSNDLATFTGGLIDPWLDLLDGSISKINPFRLKLESDPFQVNFPTQLGLDVDVNLGLGKLKNEVSNENSLSILNKLIIDESALTEIRDDISFLSKVMTFGNYRDIENESTYLKVTIFPKDGAVDKELRFNIKIKNNNTPYSEGLLFINKNSVRVSKNILKLDPKYTNAVESTDFMNQVHSYSKEFKLNLPVSKVNTLEIEILKLTTNSSIDANFDQINEIKVELIRVGKNIEESLGLFEMSDILRVHFPIKTSFLVDNNSFIKYFKQKEIVALTENSQEITVLTHLKNAIDICDVPRNTQPDSDQESNILSYLGLRAKVTEKLFSELIQARTALINLNQKKDSSDYRQRFKFSIHTMSDAHEFYKNYRIKITTTDPDDLPVSHDYNLPTSSNCYYEQTIFPFLRKHGKHNIDIDFTSSDSGGGSLELSIKQGFLDNLARIKSSAIADSHKDLKSSKLSFVVDNTIGENTSNEEKEVEMDLGN